MLPVAVDGETVSVQILGQGSTVVILSNQSDEDLCAWLPFAAVLSDNGFRVALWDYGGASPIDELAAVADAVQANTVPGDAVRAVVLMGASKGAKVSLVTARRMNAPHIIGVVSLSAEATLRPDTDVASAVAGLHTPTLLVTSDDDPYGSAQALEPIRRGIVTAEVLRVSGADHGTAMLADADVATAVLAFLRGIGAG